MLRTSHCYDIYKRFYIFIMFKFIYRPNNKLKIYSCTKSASLQREHFVLETVRKGERESERARGEG